MADYRQIVATARSAAPPQAVFDVVADGARWQEWLPFVPRSVVERAGDPSPDGVGSVRRFGLGPIGSREEITSYAPPHHLAYVARSGIPVRSYRATVRFEPSAGPGAGGGAGGGTDITWHGELDALPGTGGLMGLVFGRLLRILATNAAREAERRQRDGR